MRSTLSALILLIATSCHHRTPPTHYHRVHPDLWNAVHEFETTFSTEVLAILRLADLGTNEEGYKIWAKCRRDATPPIVEIDEDALGYTHHWVEFLVFHELGHCHYNLPHINEPYSIMRNGFQPYWMDDYQAHRKRYVEHLRDLIGNVQPVYHRR